MISFDRTISNSLLPPAERSERRLCFHFVCLSTGGGPIPQCIATLQPPPPPAPAPPPHPTPAPAPPPPPPRFFFCEFFFFVNFFFVNFFFFFEKGGGEGGVGGMPLAVTQEDCLVSIIFTFVTVSSRFFSTSIFALVNSSLNDCS